MHYMMALPFSAHSLKTYNIPPQKMEQQLTTSTADPQNLERPYFWALIGLGKIAQSRPQMANEIVVIVC